MDVCSGQVKTKNNVEVLKSTNMPKKLTQSIDTDQ